MSITGITKEGSFIVIGISDRPNPIKYDCKDRLLYSFTGRQVRTMPACIPKEYDMDHNQRRIIGAIRDALKGDFSKLRAIEMFFTVLDLVQYLSDAPSECPKGYIKWVQDNNLKISRSTLEEYKIYMSSKQWSNSVREAYDEIRNRLYESQRMFFLRATIEQKGIITKILKSTKKEFSWAPESDMRNFFNIISSFDNWENYVDTNRGFTYNVQLLKDIRDKERNEKIIENQKKIKQIETLSNDTYTIIVPVTMEEFTDEGKQQNNCVGHYYHNSIAKGDNLIYFIRKTANPKHSYITNRYNVTGYKPRTVETRTVNNNSNNDKDALDLIEKIDKMINTILWGE